MRWVRYLFALQGLDQTSSGKKWRLPSSSTTSCSSTVGDWTARTSRWHTRTWSSARACPSRYGATSSLIRPLGSSGSSSVHASSYRSIKKQEAGAEDDERLKLFDSSATVTERECSQSKSSETGHMETGWVFRRRRQCSQSKSSEGNNFTARLDGDFLTC